jgi:hypothetical protein
MKWLVLVVSIPLWALLTPPSLAHTLSLDGARRIANREAAELARAGSINGERVTYLVVKCTRARTVTGLPKPHVVDCRTTFSFRELQQDCVGTIRVAFAREGSRRLIISYPGKPVCKAQ